MAMKFISKWVMEPLDSLTYAWRQVLDKLGLMNSIDDFVYRRIEDPIFYLLFTNLYDFKAFGDDVIPKEGPALLVSNHQSLLDPIVTGLATVHNSKRIPFQLAKAELGADPFLNNFTRLNKAIFIRRGDGDTVAMDRCKEVLNEGSLLIYYPEGTINEGNGKMLPFKTGVARLAFDAKVPVIPVATYGIDQIFGKGAKAPKSKGKLRVSFGDPIPLDKLFKLEEGKVPDAEEFEKATKKIQREVGKLWSDLWMMAEKEAKEVKDGKDAKAPQIAPPKAAQKELPKDLKSGSKAPTDGAPPKKSIPRAASIPKNGDTSIYAACGKRPDQDEAGKKDAKASPKP